jgi:hypothetical protein
MITEVLPNQVNSFVIPQPPSNSTSSASSAPSASGKPISSGNYTGAYPYTSNAAPYPVTTSTVTKVKTYTITDVKGSPTYSFSKYTTTTVCPVATAKKTETIPQGRFGPPGHYSYVPLVTQAAVATASGLAYPTCVPKTVYTTVTVY